MSVDYYVCNYCDDTFPDCGCFLTCESCGTKWCTDECAKQDGYIREHCEKHPDLDCRDLMESYRETHCSYEDCYDCDYYEPDSCKYCRHEDYNDYVILEKTLELLNMTREDVIKLINNEKGEK